MVPVALSLTGLHLKLETIFFLGWFGPRGLAFILFALLVLEESTLPGKQMIQHVVMTTVCLSVFAHGLTAVPWAKGYARRMETPKPGMAEQVAVDEMPVRVPYRRS
jgi:NhaP-type Na+/H+ or K+/H+ antiporter